MATPTPAAAAPAAASPASKNAPHLHSVASSLRSCLDGMLPDNLRNDAAAFHQHLDQQKNRVQTEKNSWRFGLNYLFETLKQHKDWYARNQQFVQLKKDVKRFDAHLATVRGILSESVSKLDLEAGLRGAELEGRVGAYRVMFEVTKIVSKLSRPLVKLQILKPNETSLSIYCDTFVLDIALSGGDGDVESASLTTVKDEQSNQFPDRDEDLLQSLKLLAGGDSSSFTEKLVRLINRAELAVKFPSLNFEQLEEQLYTTVTEACTQQSCWTVKRAVEGVTIHFKNSLHCVPISEPPRKRGRVEDPQVAGSGTGISNASDDTTDNEDMMNGVDRNGMGDGSNESAITSSDAPRATPLSGGEWSGSVSFIEWRGEVALQVAGCTPVVMVGLQARRLALAIMRKRGEAGDDLGTASADSSEDEKLFNEFVSWTDPEGHKPISPHLHFARDQSLCTVLPPRSHLPMRLEFSLTTKEISGGLRLASFPIPLSHLSTPTIAEVLQICGHSMFFHSLLLSAFSTKNNLFGERIPADSETAVNARIKVDVAAPDRVTLNAGEVLGPGKQVLIEFTTKADCVLAMSVKYLSGSPSEHSTPHPPLENEETIAKLVASCHSIPLLTYYSLKRPLLTLHGQVGSVATGGATSGEDCNGIAAVDDDLGVTMKMEGEDMLLDEMSMF